MKQTKLLLIILLASILIVGGCTDPMEKDRIHKRIRYLNGISPADMSCEELSETYHLYFESRNMFTGIMWNKNTIVEVMQLKGCKLE